MTKTKRKEFLIDNLNFIIFIFKDLKSIKLSNYLINSMENVTKHFYFFIIIYILTFKSYKKKKIKTLKTDCPLIVTLLKMYNIFLLLMKQINNKTMSINAAIKLILFNNIYIILKV